MSQLYEGNVFRPPSEAFSLIVQATVGCSHNKCTFCSMYKGDKFKIKSVDRIKEDLDEFFNMYGGSNVRRVFIADGDALAMKTEDLVEIFEYINRLFPLRERIGIYGSPGSILRKSREDLEKLKNLGLGIVYLGAESGNPEILKKIKKGVTRDEMIQAGKKVKSAGIPLSVTLISGIGSYELTREHALDSASMINEMSPDYLGLLTLLVQRGTELYEEVESGKFKLLEPRDVLLETKLMVENIDVESCVFRSNHASNYVNLRGSLNRDKESILKQIETGLRMSNLGDKTRLL